MGVYHFAGLGTSPGAVTSPLTIIYILLKSAKLGDKRARDFFRHSGERGQELKGAPENLILFTSRDVINGMKPKNQLMSRLFPNKKFGDNIVEIIHNFLSNLTEALGLSRIYDEGWIKKIYLVEVDHLKFDDCYPKVNTFLYACRDKECWINAQAGSNPINTSLILAGSLNLISWKYYHVRQTSIDLLDLDSLRQDALEDPQPYIDKLLSLWGELEIFGLGIHDVLRRLNDLFSSRARINISELEKILEENGLSRIFLRKLEPYLKLQGDSVSKSERFDKLLQAFSNRWAQADNSTEAWRLAREKGILYEVDVTTGEVEKA
ncbi:MAG: hypothetical protein RMJ28_02755 [Nitrososphaerota archaeon]|nr:hypothetical protein [Candidatus Calditenuaceae archaeon]MDW8073140.1 hypothetical protein [Nitrososphaerota archaeon]